jgi:pyridoxamine 5'-phosphate oxidase
MDLARRREYESEGLAPEDLDPDPLTQIRAWLSEAEATGLPEPSAMALATADADGAPHCRFVLLRGIDDRGLCFFTNRQSAKAMELAANPRAELCFWWPQLYRQIRVHGTAEPLEDSASDVYFGTRPRGSQIGAWASPQSAVIPDRELLEARVAEVTERFGDGDIPRPEFWGGYRVTPVTVELWQGRRSRLHDRLRYRRDGDRWIIERLAP